MTSSAVDGRVTMGTGKESPSHGFAVPAPFRQGGQGDGGRIATGAERPRNDRGLYMGRGVRRADVGIGPYAPFTDRIL